MDDVTVSNNTRDQIRSSDSSVPNKVLPQNQARNIMQPSDSKRCQNKMNGGNSLEVNGENAQSKGCSSNTQTMFTNPNFQNGSSSGGTQTESFYNPTSSNNKINHYHKIHKNVRNRARKFDSNRPSKSAFLGGLFTDLTASEDTLLLENGEVHPRSERSKLPSNDPMIKMPSIFGSITNINNNNNNNNNSALIRDSPVASGAISKNTRPPRKSVTVKSPAKEVDTRTGHLVTSTSEVDKENSSRQRRPTNIHTNPELPGNRSVNDQIGIEKQLSSSVKGKKGPQVSIILSI